MSMQMRMWMDTKMSINLKMGGDKVADGDEHEYEHVYDGDEDADEYPDECEDADEHEVEDDNEDDYGYQK